MNKLRAFILLLSSICTSLVAMEVQEPATKKQKIAVGQQEVGKLRDLCSLQLFKWAYEDKNLVKNIKTMPLQENILPYLNLYKRLCYSFGYRAVAARIPNKQIEDLKARPDFEYHLRLFQGPDGLPRLYSLWHASHLAQRKKEIKLHDPKFEIVNHLLRTRWSEIEDITPSLQSILQDPDLYEPFIYASNKMVNFRYSNYVLEQAMSLAFEIKAKNFIAFLLKEAMPFNSALLCALGMRQIDQRGGTCMFNDEMAQFMWQWREHQKPISQQEKQELLFEVLHDSKYLPGKASLALEFLTSKGVSANCPLNADTSLTIKPRIDLDQELLKKLLTHASCPLSCADLAYLLEILTVKYSGSPFCEISKVLNVCTGERWTIDNGPDYLNLSPFNYPRFQTLPVHIKPLLILDAVSAQASEGKIQLSKDTIQKALTILRQFQIPIDLQKLALYYKSPGLTYLLKSVEDLP